MPRIGSRVQEMADRTPARRERYVDLLRAVAITAVVTGHWLVIHVEYDAAGQLTGDSVLGELTWGHPVTWLFQVMPVFFIVGGFANAASLQAHRRRHGDDAGWLLDRSTRLVRPTTVLLVAIAGLSLLATLLGAVDEQIGTAAWLVSIPLWFLVVYLGMIALTPLMHALHRRAGWWVPVLLLVPVVVGDVLRFQTGTEVAAWGNYLFGWLAIHQLGFSWQDGRLPARPRVAVPLLGTGLGALILLTTVGPYPTSMVTVPGETMQNSSPPTMALLALATAQLGLALLLRDPCERWLRRRRPWTVVVGVNAVILTIFLWHMSAVVVLALLLHALGMLPTPPVDSAEWLLWQLPWLAMLAVVLAGLVALFGQVEARATTGGGRAPGVPTGPAQWSGRPLWQRGPSPLLVATVVGYAAALAGLLQVAMAGEAYHGPLGLPVAALATYFAGAAVLRLARAARRTARAADQPATD